MDVEVLTKELEARRTRFWTIAEPHEVAHWVMEPPGAGAAPAELPGARELVEQMRAPDPAEPIRPFALGQIGRVVRATVPHAAEGAGRHWQLTLTELPELRVARLTVGSSEVATLRWRPDDDDTELTLRLAAYPIEHAVATGDVDPAEMAGWGIVEQPDDDPGTSARYLCPGEEAASWFLRQPAVQVAARLMNARLCADGRFPVAHDYDAGLAAMAWAAAEGPGTEPSPTGVRDGFDRPYRRHPVTIVGPVTQRFSVQAHQAAAEEHNLLCRRLIAHLAMHGIKAGELVRPRIDLAWRGVHRTQVVALVKSCFGTGATDQLRSGLGQLLEYRARLLESRGEATAVLLVSTVPEPIWFDICRQAGVHLLDGTAEERWNAAEL
jgi:hypothetical protein